MSESKLLKDMGERIYAQRRDLKLTQDELAEMIGVSVQMISTLELGKKAIRPENLVKICQALNISADYILTGNTAAVTGKAPKADGVAEKLRRLSTDELKLLDNFVDYMLAKS